MGDIDQRKNSIIYSLGDAAIAILRDAGIDVDYGITRMLEQQTGALESKAYSGSVDYMMTSELVYHSRSPKDEYGTEFTRRLSLIGLSEDQISSLYHLEALILSADGLRDEREGPWVKRYFFVDKQTTVDNSPSIGQLTLSELILITDDANASFARDHNNLSDETWTAVCRSSVQGQAHYAYGLRERVQKLNWSHEQEAAFGKNEVLLLERLKWGYHQMQAWTPQTIRA